MGACSEYKRVNDMIDDEIHQIDKLKGSEMILTLYTYSMQLYVLCISVKSILIE